MKVMYDRVEGLLEETVVLLSKNIICKKRNRKIFKIFSLEFVNIRLDNHNGNPLPKKNFVRNVLKIIRPKSSIAWHRKKIITVEYFIIHRSQIH